MNPVNDRPAGMKADPGPPPRLKLDNLFPDQRLTYLEGDVEKAKAFILNVVGLALSTGLVGGLVWVATHLGVVFG